MTLRVKGKVIFASSRRCALALNSSWRIKWLWFSRRWSDMFIRRARRTRSLNLVGPALPRRPLLLIPQMNFGVAGTSRQPSSASRLALQTLRWFYKPMIRFGFGKKNQRRKHGGKNIGTRHLFAPIFLPSVLLSSARTVKWLAEQLQMGERHYGTNNR